MTIGIALTLPDGVLLVADGRQTSPYSNGNSPENNLDKLVQISSTIYVIPFGIIQATDFSILILRKSILENSRPEQISSMCVSCVRAGWQYLLNNVSDDVNINDIRMRAALIIGGITGDELFITGTLVSSNIPPQPILYKNIPFQLFMLGGEDQQAFNLFNQRASVCIRNIPWDYSSGPINITIKALLNEAMTVIRNIESQNSEIGGILRYVVIRKGFATKKEILNETYF